MINEWSVILITYKISRMVGYVWVTANLKLYILLGWCWMYTYSCAMEILLFIPYDVANPSQLYNGYVHQFCVCVYMIYLFIIRYFLFLAI